MNGVLSQGFFPKGGQNEIVWIIGGQDVFVCKACGKLGGSGGHAPPGNFGFFDLSLDAIWWNLELFSHKHLLCH